MTLNRDQIGLDGLFTQTHVHMSFMCACFLKQMRQINSRTIPEIVKQVDARLLLNLFSYFYYIQLQHNCFTINSDRSLSFTEEDFFSTLQQLYFQQYRRQHIRTYTDTLTSGNAVTLCPFHLYHHTETKYKK